MLDGMDSFIFALALVPAMKELLPGSGYAATPAHVAAAVGAEAALCALLDGGADADARNHVRRLYPEP